MRTSLFVFVVMLLVMPAMAAPFVSNVTGGAVTVPVKFSYTGTADDFEQIRINYKFDIFFNINKKAEERKKSANFAEACPCDSGKLAHDKSCSYCSKCWK